jgi:hypothetical protein
MEIIPYHLKRRIPNEIIYIIYEYIDHKNKNCINRINNVNLFIYKFLEIENRNRPMTILYNYDNHEIMENYIKLKTNLKFCKDIFNFLKPCKCCEKHQYNTPSTIYDYWDTQSLKVINNNCLCPCRHIKRLLCVMV